MSSLISLLRAEIARSGPIPFRRFMERALYDPEHGYYAGGRAVIGRRGDFVTSVSVGPLFGRLLAAQFEEMWRNLDRPVVFDVVEQGADRADFAHDVLSAARIYPEFSAALRYRIVEPLEANLERQRARLEDFAGRVAWHRSLEELPEFTGVHFSNELVDALPVVAVIFRDGEWRERCVDAGERGLAWTDRTIADAEILRMLEGVPRIEGYQTEVCPEAPRWLAAVEARLTRGYVMVADYGFSREDYYLPERTEGTLSAYCRQRRSTDLLADPGEQDLTAHVDFTTLAEAGLARGLEFAGFTDQHHFLAALGKRIFPDITDPAELTPERQKAMREFAMLMHPSMMGLGFQYLALAKAAPVRLCGYELGGGGAGRLGLSET